MTRIQARRGQNYLRGIGRQRGQALIYGLFVMIGGLASLFFLFNTGQLSREKTKLVNTTDAVAYSAGVMHARALNFVAYTNRAMVANTVAIAQLVSISSWIQYTSNIASFGAVLSDPKYATYYASYYDAVATGPYLQAALNDSGALSDLASTSDRIIRNGLMTAQSVAYAGLLPARQQVMDEVSQANYRGDGDVSVDLVPLTVGEFTDFSKRYSDNDRGRFADVATTSVKLDGFARKRSWTLPALYPDCISALPRTDWLSRRGGTELIGFDEWNAMDSLSDWRWVPKSKTDVLCEAIAETPAGWGDQGAADSFAPDIDPLHYDASVLTNPGASGLAIATSSSWSYSGLPSFYDLSDAALADADPRLRFAIRLRRHMSQTATSEGRSSIAPSGRLNDYQADPAGGSEMAAVSASEVFFDRSGGISDNSYGVGIGRPREIASLFNPFWQVHLIQSAADVRKAQLLQGALLP